MFIWRFFKLENFLSIALTFLIFHRANSISTKVVGSLNDDCFFAQSLQCGQTVFGETSPLLETDFFDEDCGVSPPTSTGQWFAFEGTGDVLNVSSCGTLFNSSISVFSGSCLNLNCIVDGFFENSECTDEGFDNALVSFQTSPGIPYYLYLFSNDGSVPASYTISATCEVPSPAPGNDSCESPLLLEINGPSLLATNLGSTSSGQTFENCTSISGEVTQNDVWFSFQAPESGRIVLETFAGSLQNTRMQIFDSCGGNTIACDEESGNGSMSRIELSCETYTPGQVYLIQLEGAGSMGTFSISITTESCELIFGCTNPDACNYNPAATIDNESCLIPLPGCHACVGDELVLIDADGDGVCDAEDECPNDPNKTIPGICGCGELEEDENANGICDVEETPSNDTPCTAMAIACGEIEIVVGTTFSATAQETCASGENRVGVWYQITVNETSVISLQTCFKQTDFNTEISVFSGTCDNLNCVPEVGETGLIPSGVNCESSPGTNGTQGEFIADPGAYYIMVHGTSTAESGSFALSVTCEPILVTSLTGMVTWNSACGERDADLELYETGTAILAGSQEVVISEGGTFSADFELLGSFDIYLKVDGFLAVSESTVVLDTNPMDILFDPLPPGDLSGSNTVGLPDFSSFSSAYGSGAGSPGFNVLADFNCDGAIDLQDFSIFSTNYGSSGAEP